MCIYFSFLSSSKTIPFRNVLFKSSFYRSPCFHPTQWEQKTHNTTKFEYKVVDLSRDYTQHIFINVVLAFSSTTVAKSRAKCCFYSFERFISDLMHYTITFHFICTGWIKLYFTDIIFVISRKNLNGNVNFFTFQNFVCTIFCLPQRKYIVQRKCCN